MKREKVLDDIAVGYRYEWKGQLRTLADWATVLGIKVKTLYGRLEEGWTVDRAFSTPVRKNTVTYVTMPNGEKMTPAHLADHLGLPRSTVASQLERGWSVEKILDRGQEQAEKPQPGKARLLGIHYRRLVKLVGKLERDGTAPSTAWFAAVDECLDRIWALDDVLSDNSGMAAAWIERVPEPEPETILPMRRKERALTMEEADAIRRKQNGHPVAINPNWNPEKIHLSPDVDNRD